MASTTIEPVPTKHEQFYFDDGNAIFLVGDTLFKVHRSFLCRDPESLFKSLFLLPIPQTSNTNPAVPGSSDLTHIPIHDVDPKVFTVVIQLVYARAVGATTDTASSLPITEWIPLFELVDRFCMDSLIQYCVDNITSIPAEKLVGDLGSRFLHLANRFTALFTTEYRESLFRHMLAREDSLSEEEMELLGFQLSARISRLREKLRKPGVQQPSAYCGCGPTYRNIYCRNCGSQRPMQTPQSDLNYVSLSESAKQHSLLA